MIIGADLFSVSLQGLLEKTAGPDDACAGDCPGWGTKHIDAARDTFEAGFGIADIDRVSPDASPVAATLLDRLLGGREAIEVAGQNADGIAATRQRMR